MEKLSVPALKEIRTMPAMSCQHERIRLKNELSFARGNSMWGGPSSETAIAVLKQAIDAIERRLSELRRSEQEQNVAQC